MLLSSMMRGDIRSLITLHCAATNLRQAKHVPALAFRAATQLDNFLGSSEVTRRLIPRSHARRYPSSALLGLAGECAEEACELWALGDEDGSVARAIEALGLVTAVLFPEAA